MIACVINLTKHISYFSASVSGHVAKYLSQWRTQWPFFHFELKINQGEGSETASRSQHKYSLSVLVPIMNSEKDHPGMSVKFSDTHPHLFDYTFVFDIFMNFNPSYWKWNYYRRELLRRKVMGIYWKRDRVLVKMQMFLTEYNWTDPLLWPRLSWVDVRKTEWWLSFP